MKLLHTLPLFFTVAILLISCGNPEKEKLQHLARGNEYLKEKKFAEARIEFRSALQLDKKLAQAHYGLGEAALALGYIQEAAESYYESIRLDANNLEARIRVGGLLAQYSNEESLKEAERLAKDVLQKNPDYIDGHLLTANINIAKKQWGEAEKSLQRAIQLDSNRVATQINLARYYDQRAKAEPEKGRDFRKQADEVFRQTIEKHPNSTDARLAYGDYLFADNRSQEAEQQLLAALNSNPKDKLALIALQRYYENLERYDESEKYLLRLVELDPDKSAGRAQIIDLHARTGRSSQAIAEYRQLIADDPKYLRGYSRIAELLLEQGDVGGAAKQIEAALKINPQDTDALLIRGRLYTINGQFREAVSDLDQALRFEPSMPAALYYASDAHLQNNDPTQARLIINRLLSFYPRNPMGLLMVVRIHLNEGKSAEAEKISSQIIESVSQLKLNDPALRAARIPIESLPEWESKAFTSRAVARIQLRNFAGARADLERAIQINSRGPEPYTNLATIFLATGDAAKAQRAAERAVELAPGDIGAATALINVYIHQKNYQTAHQKLDALLNSYPNRLQLLEQKARVFVAQNEKANAESTFRRIIELDPNHMSAYFALSDFYQSSQRQTDRAIEQLREVIRLRPNNVQQLAQAHLFIGMLEEGRGNVDEAVKNYEQTLSYDKRSVGAAIALNNLAWLYSDKGKGNLDKATDHARSAIAIAPEASFFDTLGFVYYKKRQYDIAIEQFNKAIARKPANPNYYLHLARAFRDNGDTQKARVSYEKALQLGGSNFSDADFARQELSQLKKS